MPLAYIPLDLRLDILNSLHRILVQIFIIALYGADDDGDEQV